MENVTLGTAMTNSHSNDIKVSCTTNSSTVTTDATEVESQFNAFLYIVVVLSFYAMSLVLMMVKFIRRENEEAIFENYYIEFVKREKFAGRNLRDERTCTYKQMANEENEIVDSQPISGVIVENETVYAVDKSGETRANGIFVENENEIRHIDDRGTSIGIQLDGVLVEGGTSVYEGAIASEAAKAARLGPPMETAL